LKVKFAVFNGWFIYQKVFWGEILQQNHILKWAASITNFIHARGLHNRQLYLFSSWYGKRVWKLDISHRSLPVVLTQCAEGLLGFQEGNYYIPRSEEQYMTEIEY
jgi:hypothetical protein